MSQKKKQPLYASPSYIAASPEERKARSNGCGAKGILDFVPDTFYGLSVTQACNIHDWMYSDGRTLADKEAADRIFLNNMLRIISNHTENRLLLALRRRRAYTYYECVKRFGAPAFFAGKNPPENELHAD